jgi:hypothetical protein
VDAIEECTVCVAVAVSLAKEGVDLYSDWALASTFLAIVTSL